MNKITITFTNREVRDIFEYEGVATERLVADLKVRGYQTSDYDIGATREWFSPQSIVSIKWTSTTTKEPAR